MRCLGLTAAVAALGFASSAHAASYTENVSVVPIITGAGLSRYGEGAATFAPITLVPGDTFDIEATFTSPVDFGDMSNLGAYVDGAITNNRDNESHLYYRDYYDGLRGIVTTPFGSSGPYGGYVSSYGYSLIGMFGGESGSYATLSGTNFDFIGVPEPTAWALMILGLGSLGLGMRRRKQLECAAA